MLAHYRIYDDEILRYMNYALYCINKLKKIFREFRKEKRDLINYFNFLKYYILSHWILHIKKYETSIKYNNFAKETMHKEVKSQYDRTNKHSNY